MFKNMAKSMGGMGKNMRFDQNAMNRMTKRESRVANMKIKADQQRAAKAEHKEAEFEKIRQRIKAQNEARQKCSITQTNDPNHLVFKIDGDGEQEKTFIHPELELIIQEEENEKANKLTSKKTKKKKKKSKK
jgi:hypothetical protein